LSSSTCSFRDGEHREDIVAALSSSSERTGANWQGERGHFNADMLKRYVPDRSNRVFYLSGPNRMVRSAKDVLLQLKISKRRIKTDYFPGF